MAKGIEKIFKKYDREDLERKLRDRSHVSLYYLSKGKTHVPSPLLMATDLFNAILAPRIECLPCLKWQKDVHGRFSMNMSKKFYGHLSDHYYDTYTSTLNLLERYEARHPVILLGLAAWKASCIIHGPILHGHPTTFLRYLSEGWKKTKQEHFKCNDMEIIVFSVVSFLFDKDCIPLCYPDTKPLFGAKTTARITASNENKRRRSSSFFSSSSDDDSDGLE